jgi:hypothetical protein
MSKAYLKSDHFSGGGSMHRPASFRSRWTAPAPLASSIETELSGHQFFKFLEGAALKTLVIQDTHYPVVFFQRTKAGALCHKVEEDESGWDFLIEFPAKPFAGPADMQPPTDLHACDRKIAQISAMQMVAGAWLSL